MSKNRNDDKECITGNPDEIIFKAYANRETRLGELPISRALPHRERRMIGAWCFLDRFGPLAFTNEKPMKVPPHPHIGLQTVSWLIEGEILHTDSLGSETILHPGGVNVMTAGRGIAHAEETPPNNSGRLSGVQLWVALPDQHRNGASDFTSVTQVPTIETQCGVIQLFVGTYDGITAPISYFSEILGMDIKVNPHQTVTLSLNTRFEYGFLLLEGDCIVENQPLGEKILYDPGVGHESLSLSSQESCRVLLIGGLPFSEEILMWWNFVARTPAEISKAREDWEDHRHFGEVHGTRLKRLSAPDLARIAQPNPAS